MRLVRIPYSRHESVRLQQGYDFRDPNQRDPMYKAFRGHALKKQWQALSKDDNHE